MRKYLFSTGVIGVITGALPLLKELRGGTPITWRVALGWLSWTIAVVLAVGAFVDLRRAVTGALVAADSPFAGEEAKLIARRQKRLARR